MSQQKDTDPEEYKRLHSEREAHLKRIQQLVEETGRLKADAARLERLSSQDTPKSQFSFLCIDKLLVLYRNSGSLTVLQSQVQNLMQKVQKIMVERDNLKKDQEAKNLDIQEKLKTITQVKKIGRRYKTQYEELKVEYDKVRKQGLWLRVCKCVFGVEVCVNWFFV